MNERSPTLSFFRFSYEDRPPSVHTTSFDRPNFSFSFSSRGLSVTVSAVFPGSMHIASGKPSRSMNRPICTTGSGRPSLQRPYRTRPPSSSHSKK